MRLWPAVLVACLFAGPALAGEDALRRAAAENYVRSPAQQEMLDDILSVELMVVQITSTHPEIGDARRSEVIALAVEEFARVRPDLEEAMIDAAFNTFTLAEIEALDRFYRSEEGQAVIRKSRGYERSLWHGVSQISKSMQDKLLARVKTEILKAE